ncbi:hypothetical protein JY651_00250 [Pyxidicoccus parkwayensis]|uniref:Restriction endonuclease type IV Mrr domain-containing protein n=1 Tax=Pyxidicoccus parkwayensis TaxID=2813578 RepID=A0ABX7NYJ9_9BACT|nr:hypothetical protein [Pyxidicoccus parkwaysis]QSQ23454.1 hypothetical protein JY651_00250 [Pyxidicoccus parkwaysis]
MGVEEEYARRVQGMGPAEIRVLWEQVKARKVPEAWPPGRALEFLLLRAFQLERARVVWPYVNDHEQIDGAIHSDGLACIVETKDHADSIGFEPIAKLTLQLQRRPGAAVGLLFSSSKLSLSVIEAVKVHPIRNVLLWRGSDIDMAFQHGMRASLRIKWRRAVELGDLSYELQKEDFA